MDNGEAFGVFLFIALELGLWIVFPWGMLALHVLGISMFILGSIAVWLFTD